MSPLSLFLQTLRYRAALAMIRLIRYLPYSLALRLFQLLGLLAWLADPFHRRIARIQMQTALGLVNPGPYVMKVFMNQAEILVDTVKYAYLSDAEIQRKIVVEGREYLDGALMKGKGLMMITGHIGNWEILSHIPRILGIQFCVMADRRQDGKLESIVDDIRSRSGATILPPTGKALMLIKELKKGKTIGMVVDNRGDKKEPFFCTVFGMPALTNPAPAFIAIKGDAVVLPVHAVKLNGIYHIRFHQPVEASSFGQGKEAIQALSDYMQSWICSVVKNHPEQWFWLYSRWLRRPDLRNVLKNGWDFRECAFRYEKELGRTDGKHSKS